MNAEPVIGLIERTGHGHNQVAIADRLTRPWDSNEAANSGGLDLAKIDRLLWSALDDEAAEFRQLVSERQEVLEGR